MSSMFGGFGHLEQMGQAGGISVSVGPSGGGPGGFPGIFPGGGVSNSGFAGLNQLQNQQPCGPGDVKAGRCVLGPPPQLMGNKKVR